jgi:ERCC4-type nuclease
MADSDPKGPTRGKKGASGVYLIVDARERAVIPFIETELQDHAYVQKQINTGDYLVCRAGRGGSEPKILACIERKTHEDFAASFKDGRYENIKKMRALRAATGCHLYYFIEGPAFPNPNRRFARIPFSSILAAITKLMVRDGVFIVQTEDESHSAKRLADFLRAFDSETPYAAPPDSQVDPASDEATGGALAVPDVLKARIDQTDDEAAVNMWARLRGISVVLGKILTREFTVAELATQRIAPDRIRALKTATGRSINKDAIKSLLAVRAGSTEHAVKLVSGLRNITPAVAKLILESAGGLSRLCAQPTVLLAGVKLPQKTRTVQLGKTRAERIRRILHYRERTAPPAEEAGHTLATHPKPDQESSGPDECEGTDGIPVPPDSDVKAILSAAGFK